MPKKLLIIGASQVGRLAQERPFLQQEYNLEIITNFRPGRRLSECVGVVRCMMQPDVDILFVWAVVTQAFKRVEIKRWNSDQAITVFAPDPTISEEIINKYMADIVNYAKSMNSDCNVYLVLPSMIDMYTFNQTRLRRKWGPRYENFLADHEELNPRKMWENMIHIHEFFGSIAQYNDNWPHKKFIRTQRVLTTFYGRKLSRAKQRASRTGGYMNLPPLYKFIAGESFTLNSELLSDGLHGSGTFFRLLFKGYKKIFVNSDSQQDPNTTVRRIPMEPLVPSGNSNEDLIVNVNSDDYIILDEVGDDNSEEKQLEQLDSDGPENIPDSVELGSSGDEEAETERLFWSSVNIDSIREHMGRANQNNDPPVQIENREIRLSSDSVNMMEAMEVHPSMLSPMSGCSLNIPSVLPHFDDENRNNVNMTCATPTSPVELPVQSVPSRGLAVLPSVDECRTILQESMSRMLPPAPSDYQRGIIYARISEAVRQLKENT